uniref:YEATS domain-containing protein n=1 Tax=Euplotes harpa TaxID=151035 RepID=A0A7S3N366_9SPIT|mmetsp:Transcript_15950/g.18508  ORF Transcript_15950/g.18508 Transcript_15950/m.18508 type:complete len:157 (+) Transcript_15950:256-726(+)
MKAKSKEENTVTLRITCGNLHKATYPNVKDLTSVQEKTKFTWIAFVDCGLTRNQSEMLIQKVVFGFNSSYENPIRTVSKHPFKVFEKGSEPFEVSIIIHWRARLKMKALTLKHTLSFVNHENCSVHLLKIKRAYLSDPEIKQTTEKVINKSRFKLR